MFERFTRDARAVVVGAQHEARQLRHHHIGTEHLLLAMLAQPGTTSATVFDRQGLTYAAALESVRGYVGGDDLDAEALTTVGIDLEAVRESVEAAFGPGALDAGGKGGPEPTGHIPFTPRAKKVLELALRESIGLKQRTILDGHIALGLLREGEGLAMKVLHDRGIDTAVLRDELRRAVNP